MADLFRRTTGLRKGYSKREVEEFFARAQRVYEGASDDVLTSENVRAVTFSQERHGYDDTAVDLALDRLDAALVRQERAAFVASHGQQAWLDHVAQQASTMYDRLARPVGKKFAPGERGTYSYNRDQVDSLCDRLVSFFNEGVKLTANDVRRAVFSMVKGKRGYATGSVDAFFNRAIEVLAAVE